MSAIETKVFMARVADQAEQYQDMLQFLKEIVQEKDSDLSVEERNLLSVAFKNSIGSLRAAIRTVAAIEQNKKYEEFSASCAAYREKIIGELIDICEGIIATVADHSLGKAADDKEAKAFYLKMIGDYYRYMAESATGDKLAEVTEKALEFYGQATEAAKLLTSYNSTRLGLALNFSVFHYEVKSDSSTACKIAQEALDAAKSDIDQCDGDGEARDSISIIELLKENLDLWKEGDLEEGDGENPIEDL